MSHSAAVENYQLTTERNKNNDVIASREMRTAFVRKEGSVLVERYTSLIKCELYSQQGCYANHTSLNLQS